VGTRHVKLAARGPNVALFNVLYGPTQFSNHTRAASNVQIFIKFEFQMYVKHLPVHRCFIVQLNKMEMCFNGIHICQCLWRKQRNEKIYPKIKLVIIKSRWLWFSPLVWRLPQLSPLFQEALNIHWVWHAWCTQIWSTYFTLVITLL
jgi:hypothetical protein